MACRHYGLTVVWRCNIIADKRTAAIFEGHQVKKLPTEIQDIARRKLKQIDAATRIDSLRIPPGNRLELLKGKRAGQWSIRINDQ